MLLDKAAQAAFEVGRERLDGAHNAFGGACILTAQRWTVLAALLFDPVNGGPPRTRLTRRVRDAWARHVWLMKLMLGSSPLSLE